jgi:hypothetical protein
MYLSHERWPAYGDGFQIHRVALAPEIGRVDRDGPGGRHALYSLELLSFDVGVSHYSALPKATTAPHRTGLADFPHPALQPVSQDGSGPAAHALGRVLADRPTARPFGLVLIPKHHVRVGIPSQRMGLTAGALCNWPPAPSSGSGGRRPAPGITPATPLL